MADEATDGGSVLLLDPGLVILAVGSGTGELDAPVSAVIYQRLVDEHAVIVGVDASYGKEQLSADGFQPFDHQGLFPG